MRLEILELIMNVAQSGSISAAARNGHVQQTTLSAAIKSIESELNIKIFDRQYNGVVLTREGQELIKLAEPMLDLYHRMEAIGRPSGESLTIYVNPLLYCYFCYDILPLLHMRFPEVSTAVSMAGEDPLEDGRSGDFHIGIGCCRPDEFSTRSQRAEALDLVLIKGYTSEFVAYVSKDNPLSAQKTISDISLLKGQRVIVANSICKQLFYHANLQNISKSYSIMDPFDPMQLLHAVLNNNMLAFAVDKQIIPKHLHGEVDKMAVLNIVEPAGYHYKYMLHYIVCRKKRLMTKNERAIVDFLAGPHQ